MKSARVSQWLLPCRQGIRELLHLSGPFPFIFSLYLCLSLAGEGLKIHKFTPKSDEACTLA